MQSCVEWERLKQEVRVTKLLKKHHLHKKQRAVYKLPVYVYDSLFPAQEQALFALRPRNGRFSLIAGFSAAPAAPSDPRLPPAGPVQAHWAWFPFTKQAAKWPGPQAEGCCLGSKNLASI